ncbi:MAG: hypothetical protein IT584_00785 [Chlamydiae bacterium]|nr:hypothetical protein [Chlamydiota bacterium]
MIPTELIYAEVWTIDAAQEERFNTFLTKEGVNKRPSGKSSRSPPSSSDRMGICKLFKTAPGKSKVQERLPTLIWENDVIAVYSPPEPRVEHHLWVVLQRPVSCLSEVTEGKQLPPKVGSFQLT